jgi:hypothetical protein
MGICVCPKGKGADDSGHCVYMPCPKSTSGGTTFRDKTGQCKECRSGTKPAPDGSCVR